MSEHIQLGWRIQVGPWERFVDRVAEKHAEEAVYIRVCLEEAMLEFLDDDDLLADAEDLLREYTDLSSLSSSTADVLVSDRYQDGNTKLVTHRIRAQLKERFAKYADKHGVGYGRLLSVALDAYADGGRARRIIEDVERLVTGATSSGSTDDSVENVASTGSDIGSTQESIESDFSTATASATSSGSSPTRPNANAVIDAANVLLDRLCADGPGSFQSFPQRLLDAAIGEVVGNTDQDTLDTYREPVANQINAVQHPHREDFYLSEEAREEMTLWADLDKSERIILLRRYAVAEAIERGKQKCGFTYREVADLFVDETAAGPSDQYAYDLMEDAADEAGFRYDKFSVGTETPRLQLRVNVDEVRDEILEWVHDEKCLDPADVGVNADVTTYTAGPAPSQEAGADD